MPHARCFDAPRITRTTEVETVHETGNPQVDYKPENVNVRRMHQKAEMIRAFLDRLDAASRDGGGINQRRSVRYPYRIHALSMEIVQTGAGWVHYEIPSRNLSREGASILLGHFVYPGSQCRVHLVDLNGQRYCATGRIVRCRYLEGSGTLHEVGVQFDEPIDVAQFNTEAARLRGALINEEPSVRRLAEHWFASLDVELRCIDYPGQLFDTISEEKYHFILLDAEMTGFSALSLARELRRAGYVYAIVAATDADPDFHEHCLEAGCTRILQKPYTREACAELIASLREEPIISSLGDSGSLLGLIDAFVRDLSKRMVLLESAFSDHDFESLAMLVRTLKGEGGAYGFQAITDAAGQTELAIANQASVGEIRSSLNELMRLCSSARSR